MYTWDLLVNAAHFPMDVKRAARYRHLPGGAFALAFPHDRVTTAAWHAYLYIRPEAVPAVGRIAFLWRPEALTAYVPAFSVEIRSHGPDGHALRSNLTNDPSCLSTYFSWPAIWLPDTWLDVTLMRHGDMTDDGMAGDALVLSGFLAGYQNGDVPDEVPTEPHE